MALKSSDIKYALQMCEICNTLLPPYFMCNKQCCFIQLPFHTSICSPHNDIINIFYVSSLFVRKLKMSDMKYALQICKINNALSPIDVMCNKQCFFIQLTFHTSICSPHNDIINIICLVCVVLIIRKFFKTVIVYISPTKQPN